jgi:8-oxo-dGTP pyrophosphatase MutT (NUDIX family)
MKRRIRSTAVIVHENKILVFHGIDPTSGKNFYFLPGGEIEANETPVESAARETREETGYKVRIEPKSEVIKNYNFHWNGTDYDCTTYFYRGYLTEKFEAPKPVNDVEYNKGAVWLPVEKINSLFSYTKEICDAVNQLVQFSA